MMGGKGNPPTLAVRMKKAQVQDLGFVFYLDFQTISAPLAFASSGIMVML